MPKKKPKSKMLDPKKAKLLIGGVPVEGYEPEEASTLWEPNPNIDPSQLKLKINKKIDKEAIDARLKEMEPRLKKFQTKVSAATWKKRLD